MEAPYRAPPAAGTFFRNSVLSALAPGDRDAIAGLLEGEAVVRGQVLETPMREVQKAYFLESGLATIVAGSKGQTIQIAMVGSEGMTGLGIVLGGRRATGEVRMQSEGHAFAIAADRLRELAEERPGLRAILLRAVLANQIQMAQQALCHGAAKLEQRLARWLLMVHDRLQGGDIQVTHDFISTMLAVRRPGVTVGLHELEGHQLIKANRSRIRILDRPGLIARAGAFYGGAFDEAPAHLDA